MTARADAPGVAPPFYDNGTTPNKRHEYREDPETQSCFICGWSENVHQWEAAGIAPREPLPTGQQQLKALEHDWAFGYLTRLFYALAPQCEPQCSLSSLATQLDNWIAGQQVKWEAAEQEIRTLRTQLEQRDDTIRGTGAAQLALCGRAENAERDRDRALSAIEQMRDNWKFDDAMDVCLERDEARARAEQAEGETARLRTDLDRYQSCFVATEDALAKHTRGFMDRRTAPENLAELIDRICDTSTRDVQEKQDLQQQQATLRSTLIALRDQWKAEADDPWHPVSPRDILRSCADALTQAAGLPQPEK